MSSDQGGKLGGAVEEGEGVDIEDIKGWEGNSAEIQGCGVGMSGPLDRSSGSAPPFD